MPPHSLEAERALIGCMIVDAECVPEVLHLCRPSDFYSINHETVMRAIAALSDSGTPIDKVSLVSHLQQAGQLDRIGGVEFFSSLWDSIPSVASVVYYAKIVAEKAALRRLIAAGHRIVQVAFDCEGDPERALPEALEALMTEDSSGGVNEHLAPAKRLFQAYDRAVNPEHAPRVTSPWPTLNFKLGGFYPGQMIVWAGAPKAGKTNAALTLCDHVARTHGQVVYFAIEMDVDELTERQLAMQSGVSVNRQRSSRLSNDEKDRLFDAVEECKSIPFEAVRQKIRSIGAMRRVLRSFERVAPIKAIVVDHVGKMTEVMSGSKSESKVERLDRVYNALIDVAREFACSIHVIQHVNREGQRSGRPSLIDIRDGGNPEGHAHAVIFVYREDPMNLVGRSNEGELIIAASRNGEAGIVPMRYDGLRGSWSEAQA